MFATYNISTSSYRNILYVTIQGYSDRNNADDIARDVIRIVLQHQPAGILVDVRELEGRLSTAETFFHVRNYPTDIPRYKTAIIDHEKNRAYGDFFELAAANLGHNIRCFYDREAAMKWLGAAQEVHHADAG